MRQTTRRNTAAQGEAPRDDDEIRRSLVRKIADVMNYWRACPERACRRKRGCASPRFTCMTLKPKRVRLPEHEASSIATLQRMLREKIEQQRARE